MTKTGAKTGTLSKARTRKGEGSFETGAKTGALFDDQNSVTHTSTGDI